MRYMIFSLLLFSLSFFAQTQQEIDSLYRELNRSGIADSARAHLYNELSFAYAGVDPVIGISYADSGIYFGEKSGVERLKISGLNSLGVNYWYLGKDSLALIAFEKVKEAHEKKKNRKGQATIMNNIALIQYNQGNYKGALENHEKATAIFEELGLRKNLINSTTNTGVVFLALADYPKALNYFLKALALTEETDTWELGNLYNNLGLVYKNLANYSKADENYQKGLILYRKSGNLQMQASMLGNLSVLKQIEKDLGASREYISEAISINKKIGNKRRIASDFTSLAGIYKAEGSGQTAKDYLDSAALYYREIGEKLNLSTVLIELAGLKIDSKNLNQALVLQKEALHLAQKSGSLEAQRAAWQSLASTQKKLGSFSEAITSLENFHSFQDSIFNDQNEKELLRIQISYEYDSKERELKAGFDVEKKLLAAETEKERLKGSVYLLGLGLILILAFGLFFFLRQRNKAHRQQLEAEYKTRLVELELKAIKAQMNPHFIFNALNSISNFLLKSQPEEADRYLNRFSRLIRRILDFSDTREISLQEELNLLRDYVAIEALRLGKPVEVEVNNLNEVDLEKLKIPPLLLQPLVENSLWHGIAKTSISGLISLNIQKSEKGILLVLKDNGIGRNELIKSDRNSNSMGMRLVKTRLESINSGHPSSGMTMDWESKRDGFEVRLLLFEPKFHESI